MTQTTTDLAALIARRDSLTATETSEALAVIATLGKKFGYAAQAHARQAECDLYGALPESVEHDGDRYWVTCDRGTAFATGLLSARYESDAGDRIVVDAAGNVYAD